MGLQYVKNPHRTRVSYCIERTFRVLGAHLEYECVNVILKLSEQEAVQITSECEGTVINTDVLKYQGNGIIVLGEHPFDIQTESDGLQQVVKGYTATL